MIPSGLSKVLAVGNCSGLDRVCSDVLEQASELEHAVDRD